MATDKLRTAVRDVFVLTELGSDAARSDGQLLRDFASRRDETAFALLVRRHGPMVFGVCKRVLRHLQDAEDAFQATFVVLARKAAALKQREVVGNWLYGVAHHTALKARALAAKRKTREAQLPTPEPQSEEPDREVLAILDQELTRLPALYRSAVVLCDLEGRTYKEAARQLRCPEGTVASRLARGGAILAKRLTRRGVTGASAALAATVPQLAHAAVPWTLAEATIQGATGTVAPRVLALANAVVKGLLLAKLKVVGACVMALSLLGVSCGFMYGSIGGEDAGVKAKAEDAKPAPKVAAIQAKEPAVGRDQFNDPLPKGAVARLGTVRFRHQAAVVLVAFSPDGKTLASASLDGTVRLWDSATGKERQRFSDSWIGLPAFPWFGGALNFSSDGKHLVLARYDVHVWNLASGKAVQHLNLHAPDGTFLSYLSAHFAANGTLTAASADPTLQLVNALTGRILQNFQTRGRVEFVCFSPDSRTVAVVESNNKSEQTLHFWEAATGKERRPPEPVESFRFAVFAPDGNSLAIATHDQVRLVQWPTGKELHQWKLFAGPLAFSTDGKTLAAGGLDAVHLWDIATGKTLRNLPNYQWADSIAFSPDGKTLATGSGSYMHRLHPVDDERGGVIQIWNALTGEYLGPTEAHQDVATCVAFAPDGKTLASGSRDRTVRLWDPSTGKQTAELIGHDKDVLCVAFGQDGKLLASGSKDKAVFVWDALTSKKLHRLEHEGQVHSLAFSPDTATLATADGITVRLWNTKTGKEIRQWKAAKGESVYAVAFAPDGKTLAWGGGQRVYLPDSGGNDVHLVDPATGAAVAILPGANGKMAVCSLAYSPEGALLAVGHLNTALHVWRPGTAKLVRKIQTRAEGTVTFSPDGKTLLSTGPVGATVFSYDIASGKELHKLESPQGGVHAISVAPDGKTLASAGQDGTILIWRR